MARFSRHMVTMLSLCGGLLCTSALAGQDKAFTSKTEMAQAIRDLQKDLTLTDDQSHARWTAAAAKFVTSFQEAKAPIEPIEQRPSSSQSGPRATLALTTAPIDLLLPRIAMQTGSNFHVELKQALSENSKQVLVLQEGHFTLSSLVAAIKGTNEEGSVTFEDGSYKIIRPLFIMSSAGLSVSENEVAELSTEDGAFIMNTGALSVSGGTLRGSATQNVVAEFKPFILSALGGSFRLHNSKVENLGFGNRPSMRGVSLVSSPFFPMQTELDMQGNDLAGIYAVELIGMNKLLIKNNVIRDSVSSAIRLQNVSGGIVSGNIISNSGSHGFHLFQNSKALKLTNNIVQGGKGSGIHVNGGVVATSLQDNLLIKNRKSGITLIGVACVDVLGNAVLDNGLRGIFARDNLDVRFERNLLAQNAGPAIFLQGGVFGKDKTVVAANRFIANKSGIDASRFPELELAENNFSKQLPTLFSGELKAYLSSYLGRIGKLSTGATEPFVVQSTSYSEPVPNLARASRISLSSLDHCKI